MTFARLAHRRYDLQYGWMLCLRTALDVRMWRARYGVGQVQRLYKQTDGRHLPRFSIDQIASLVQRQDECMTQALPCYVSSVGGWFTLNADIQVLDTRESDEWPVEHVSITRWPGGIHYYADIAGGRLVVDGVEKWDTRREAEQAVERWRARSVI